MRETGVGSDLEGVRCIPDQHSGVGALVLAGSSGRVDVQRARVLGGAGALSESFRWFGGPGQNPGPWEIAVELFCTRVQVLRRECDRVLVLGTSFGAEAALLTGVLCEDVDAVVAFAPSDVVWAGVTEEGRVTSHWTHGGVPLPFVPFIDGWEAGEDPPAFRDLYSRSWAAFVGEVPPARIAVERIREVILVAGGDDRVWPSVDQARRISDRRAAYDVATTVLIDPEAGHRTVLPGESVLGGGVAMRRGGDEVADRRLGRRAWEAMAPLLHQTIPHWRRSASPSFAGKIQSAPLARSRRTNPITPHPSASGEPVDERRTRLRRRLETGRPAW